jgi:hypothetical protein
MIKQFFIQPKVLSRLQEGVFGPYLPAAAALHEEGYSRGCIRRHLRAADHFGVWLTDRRLTVGDLTRATLDRYIEGKGRLYSASTPTGRLPHSAQGLHELVEFLASKGVIAPTVEVSLTSAGQWLAEFDSRSTCAFAHSTRHYYELEIRYTSSSVLSQGPNCTQQFEAVHTRHFYVGQH